ncbi:MAG: pseudouridine synthase [Gammaproteobacteria bacterium WSBS_2016_MAG_OTU1]
MNIKNSSRNKPYEKKASPIKDNPIADEKLQKVLADYGVGSRRAMEVLIKQGRVTVNRRTAKIGMRVGKRDILTVNGSPIRQTTKIIAPRLLCYHKPPGKIVERGAENSAFADLPPPNGGRWINIGRLDVNSEGLLLFSTDGNFVQKLAHPKNGVEREYLARVDGSLSAVQIKAILEGVPIDGKPLQPIHFSLHTSAGGRNHWYRVILSEGRNRTVRRLFAHYDLQVGRLIRLRMGIYSLPRDLAAGRWRELTPPTES